MRIERVLIANRGEVVERVVRTCRRLGIQTVAIYSDADANARFIELANSAVCIGGTTPAESYLNQDQVIAAALRSSADAVHPGYGFLAENADFARRCADAGLVFIGPSPEAIATMGDKVAAKRAAETAGVPLLRTLEVGDDGVSEEDLNTLSWPVIVKAAAGGGGKGMHVIEHPAGLAAAIQRASREAASAFGDGRVFIERYVTGARHVEVQVFGDRQGSTAVLHERECSIQRRHQKVVEEAPSPAVDAKLRARLADAARRAAESVAYVGAGTVEFLLSEDHQFFFLEMNTRLQVEHAVTEEITGLDLVELQILIAQGEPLPTAALNAPIHGSAVEVRLYAEDPTQGFAPAAGKLERFALVGDGLRIEAGVRSGDTVTPFYDPMLAKVIAFAPTRQEAAHRIADRLVESEIYGVRTNRDLLIRILRDSDYLENRFDTQYLERPTAEALCAPLVTPQLEGVHAVAAALAGQAARSADPSPFAGLPSGWRNNRSMPQTETLEGLHGQWEASYEMRPDGTFARARAQAPETAIAITEAPIVGSGRVDLVVGGVRHRFSVLRHTEHAWVTGAGASSSFVLPPRFPDFEIEQKGSLVASMPGTVLRVDVRIGDLVARGTVIAILEAMKMETEVVAPGDGHVSELSIVPGDQVEAGRILAVIEEIL